ncbi:MAG TPA: serine protease [Thermoanaerobaculia bacterium]|nr:serine protease [Thermoanaerobaculia bacterium]
MIRARRHNPLTAPALAAAVALAAAPAAPAAPADLANLLAAKAPAVVTVEYLLKIEVSGDLGQAMGTEHELEGTATCSFIDPKGLLLCSNMQLSGPAAQMMKGMMNNLEMTTTPAAFEVLAGPEGKSLPATLVARDSDLDLAWLQIDQPGEQRFPHLDLAARADLAVGDDFVMVRRMGHYFGGEAALQLGTVGAVVDRPHRLYVPALTAASAYGLPVFTVGGKLVGFTVLEVPDDVGGSSSTFSMLTTSSRLQEGMGGLILPAARVAQATEVAREMMAADAAEE